MTAPAARKFWPRLLAGTIITILAIWCIAWFSAYQLAGRYLDSWIARESDQGRNWACKDRTFSGFPIIFRFSCSAPSLQSTTRTGALIISFHELAIAYSPVSPLSAKIELTGPLRAETPGNIERIDGQWKSLTIDASRKLSSSTTILLQGQQIQIKLSTAENVSETIDIGKLDTMLDLFRADDKKETLQTNIIAETIVAPFLNQTLGNTSPAKLNTRFDLLAFDALKSGDPATRLDAWRSMNGALEIHEFNFTKDRLALEAGGNLRIDAQRRPAGQLNVRAAGLTSLLEKLGLPSGSGIRGGLLGGLLRKPGSHTAPAEEPTARFIPLPMALRDGYIWLGPIRTPVILRPLV